MITLQVKVHPQSYDVLIGSGALSWRHIVNIPASQYVVLYEPCMESVVRLLWTKSKHGEIVHFQKVVGGERIKTLRSIERIHRLLAQWECDRNSVIVAIGGGAFGDALGFVAATYLRGIRYVNVPTTLLSQVDSCVGGKNAVNLAEGKNLVGTFWHPSLVLCDTNALKSLPEKEWRSGLAEMIKLAAILDKPFFERLEALVKKNAKPHAKDIARALGHKIRITMRDEREMGERAFLNYGHTVGHAIEKDSHYRMTHGESVALGMIVENSIARARGILSEGDERRVRDLILHAGLPTEYRVRDKKKFQEYLIRDKKNGKGGIRCVVPKRLGVPALKEKQFGVDVLVTEIFTAMQETISKEPRRRV